MLVHQPVELVELRAVMTQDKAALTLHLILVRSKLLRCEVLLTACALSVGAERLAELHIRKCHAKPGRFVEFAVAVLGKAALGLEYSRYLCGSPLNSRHRGKLDLKRSIRRDYQRIERSGLSLQFLDEPDILILGDLSLRVSRAECNIRNLDILHAKLLESLHEHVIVLAATDNDKLLLTYLLDILDDMGLVSAEFALLHSVVGHIN